MTKYSFNEDTIENLNKKIDEHYENLLHIIVNPKKKKRRIQFKYCKEKENTMIEVS